MSTPKFAHWGTVPEVLALHSVAEISNPLPGATFLSHIERELARAIAHHFYEVRQISSLTDEAGYGILTANGWEAIVATVNGEPAILHKHDGLRTLVRFVPAQ